MSSDDDYDYWFKKLDAILKAISGAAEGIDGTLAAFVEDRPSFDDARRERIATACLSGLLAKENISAIRDLGIADTVAQTAVTYADALIAVLDEPAPKTAVVAVPRKKKK
jgi:hypothetical protein